MHAVVETRAGRVRGEERLGTWLFRGIPYARPPEGALRFRPPEAPEPWGGVRDALAAGPSAPQPVPPLAPWLRTLVGLRGNRSAEDCLYLNVWTPACDGVSRPVLVFLHGGAFLFGSGATPLYSGRRLARRGDVVVVTLNYRLGALGFLQLTELLGHEGPVASNLGLRDQVAALEWVRDNIEGFGGDPGNVTLFGESAGAMSVGALLGAPRARRLFHRAILQSGAAHHVCNSGRSTAAGEFFLRELGLGPDVAGRIREVPVDALLAAQHRTLMRLGFKAGGELPFQPAVDGELIPRPPLESIEKGEAAHIPVLIGSNRDEWKLFTLGDRATRTMDEAGLRDRIARVLPGRDEDGTRRAERALAVYRRARLGRGTFSPFELWVAFQSDRIFRYPATRLAELHSARGRTYSYLFDWKPPLVGDRLGACHALELPFVFGTLRQPALRPVFGRQAGRQMTRIVQNAWLAFAYTGNPSAEAGGAWDLYTPDRRATMVLSERPYVEQAPLESERAFWHGRLPE